MAKHVETATNLIDVVINGKRCKRREWTVKYQRLIDEIEDLASILNDWESGFIGTVVRFLDNGVLLTNKQVRTLERIHRRMT
jgi:hypothetical protein